MMVASRWVILGTNTCVCVQSTALSLVYSNDKNCAPMWLKSSLVKEVIVHLNRAMRLISRTLMATSGLR